VVGVFQVRLEGVISTVRLPVSVMGLTHERRNASDWESPTERLAWLGEKPMFCFGV
jgi:hypothetical protein